MTEAPTEARPIYTVAEVAEMFGVSKATVRKWIVDGKLQGIKPGGPKGNYRITDTEVQRLATFRYGDN